MKLNHFFLAVFSLKLVYVLANDEGQLVNPTKDAYVTMLYTIHGDMYVDGFEIGVRVLGQSLRESKTAHDYIVMCTDDVPEKVKNVLKEDGWIVKPLEKLTKTDRFNENVYKLNIWKMTEYRRIVFIDADAIVTQNIDEMFKCGKMCATFRHSDKFNSGVMVIKPSIEELNEITKIMENLTGTWYHKTFGDQIVLNNYFKNLKRATMFDPSVNENQEQLMRLSAGYNADIGIYYLDNGWSIPTKDRKIIHYTMGIVKPMFWWTYPLFDLNWKWDNLRGRLPSRFHEPSIFAFKHWLPAIVLIMVFASFRICTNMYKYVYRQRLLTKLSVVLVPGSYGWGIVFFPVVIQTLSVLFAMGTVPSIIRPQQGWFLFAVWTMFYMTLFYSFYCRYLYDAGESYGTRFITIQAARLETLIHSILLFMSIHLLFYIPFMISRFHPRAVTFVFLAVCLFIQGYISGRRVLKIWYGHNTKVVSVLPCYRLDSQLTLPSGYVYMVMDRFIYVCTLYLEIAFRNECTQGV